MIDSFKSALQSFNHLFTNSFVDIVHCRLDSIDKLGTQMELIAKGYQKTIARLKSKEADYDRFLSEHRAFLTQILTFNNANYLMGEESATEKALKQFFETRNQLINSLPKTIIDAECEENRTKNSSDSWIVGKIKFFKRIRFKLKLLWHKDKAKVQINKKLPLKYYLSNELYFSVNPELWPFIEELLLFEIELIKFYQAAFNTIHLSYPLNSPTKTQEIELQLNALLDKSTETKAFVSSYKKQLIQQIETTLSLKQKAIDEHYPKLGTWEHKRLKENKLRVNKRLKKRSSQQLKQLRSWEIALFGLSEDWSFDADIFMVINTAITTFNSKHKQRNIAAIDKVSEDVQNAVKTIDSIYQTINEEAESKSISDCQTKITKVLSNQSLFLSRLDHSQSALFVLNTIEQQIINQINNTNHKRNILNNPVEWDKIQLSDTTSVFLKDLLQFEIQPAFSAQIGQLKQSVLQQIALYEDELSNILHVSDYNFETLLAIINAEIEEDSQSNRTEVFNEGKVKVLSKLEEIVEQLEAIKNTIEKDVESSTQLLIDELLELTENEKLGALNIRIIKAKAIRQSSRLKVLLTEKITQCYHFCLVQWDSLKTKGFKLTRQLSKIYSQEEVEAQINNEISIFLSEIADTTNKLPYLYQRLFKLEAIDEGYLYHKRTTELADFENAYRNWQKGRYATLAIAAEKGAGITSVIRYAVKDKDLPITSINFQDFIKIYQPDEFVFTLADNLDLTPMNEVALLIDELNARKQIIVLEGLQFAYLKKVDGFESLKLLFEIISKTNKSIFWICTSTLHAWNYLNKVVSIEEYFGHVIKLGDFSKEEMIEIIKKRHRVSGYNIQYLPDKTSVTKNKNTKQKPEEIQASREKQYFQVLTALSKGNLSVAFIFWLRSIKRIANNTLYISSMNDFNSSFIKGLSQEKLFCLYAILLHDGLDIEGFCKVMRYTPEQGRMKLFQMVDDGLLLEIKGRFVINLLLYRSTIDSLKARNFLH
ncbi:hypothetical protein J1N10_05905 [Carboxylicivirga sp. A043]|uniref:hypothetical protein n=1 Tax=Carboxylicivirga litoralis TaxID=2816963 RepID=UPI0021CB1E33|nr:hypothetical protein [Carboxylicivirga sp. A043]MCU4155501.1 hypothetical protein [Carboxylicivirga sp. A043]